MAVPDVTVLALREAIEHLGVDIDDLIARNVKDAQRLNRIAMVLRAFYLSELSTSALQPVLDLATELNPGLSSELQRLKAGAGTDEVM